jgi:CheY-like chemotaxis protein
MSTPTPAAHPLTILLIDDDHFILDIYSLAFAHRGHTVITSLSGEDAITKVRTGIHLDLIMTDLIMPFMDGFDVLERLRDERLADGVPRVVLSNQDDTADLTKTAALGAAKHFIKIRSMPGELVTLVETFMEEWRVAASH